MIKIKNLSYHYQEDRPPFLENINLEIKKGECVLFAGKSGSGKSTILKILNGIALEFYNGKIEGNIHIEQLDLFTSEIYHLSEKIGSVFQHPKTQFYTTNTTDEIAFGLENYGLARDIINERIKDTAQTLSITPLLDKNIFALSGGEKQKIAIASVHAMKNDIFLFDEPSSSLDIISMQKLASVMQQLKRAGKTILIAEHRLWYLRDIVDRLIYLEKGKIKMDTTLESIRNLSEEERIKTGLRSLTLEDLEEKRAFTQDEEEDALLLTDLRYKNKGKEFFFVKKLIFPPRKIIGIIGKNGIGKSTFAKILAGLIKETHGTITQNGMKLSSKKRLANTLYIMQEVNQQLFTDSVLDDILLTSESKNTSDIEEALRAMHLEHLKERHPHTLSGGEKQKVIILSALLSKKKILIFDEPTSGLDYSSMHLVAQNIKKFSTHHQHTLIISHDLEFLNIVADEIVDMEEYLES